MTKEEADLIIAEQDKSKEEILKAVAKVKADYHELCNLKDMRIAELEARCNELFLQTCEQAELIEKMKCCGNCIHCYEGAYHNGYRCKDHAKESVCDNWEMMTDEVRKEMLEDD